MPCQACASLRGYCTNFAIHGLVPHRECNSTKMFRWAIKEAGGEQYQLIPFSAFWLRSSVVSVLISLISDTWVIGPLMILN